MKPLFAALPLVAAIALPGASQWLVDENSSEGRAIVQRFDQTLQDTGAAKLKCSVVRLPPTVDYGLRVWAGFNVTIPARQVFGPKPEKVAIIFRVTPKAAPEGRKYFWQRFEIPAQDAAVNLDKARQEIRLGGGFLVGRGDYRVEWLTVHSQNQSCRESWNLSSRSSDQTLLTPANTVEPWDVESWTGFPSEGTGRATIFIHAAPVWPRRYVSRLSSWDRQTLLSSLVSLLRNTRYRSACVVVFDLQRRKVIYREPEFTRASLRRLGRRMAEVDLSTISLETLEQGPRPEAFLESMVRTELTEERRNDAFIFLGTTWRAGPKLKELPGDLKEAMPRTWFLALRTPWPGEEDSVSSLVKQSRGKILNIYQPSDLAAAIRNMAAAR